jgi:GNAT superfamily N-acetyltransferase
VLARAFRDNPLNIAVIGPDEARRLRCNRVGMGVHLPAVVGSARLLGIRSGDDLVGVLVAAEPGGWPFPPAPPLSFLRLLLGQGWGVTRRWAQISDTLRPEHPLEPHAYLGSLGVEPSLWGRGLGRTLLHRWLEEVDDRGARAYLETDSRRNVPFYEGAGFQVVRELRILGVDVFTMARPPRAL